MNTRLKAWLNRARRLWPAGGRSRGRAAGSPGCDRSSWVLLQADNRPLKLRTQSKALDYDPRQDSVEMMRALNGGDLAETWTYWDLSSLINRLKCSNMGCGYAHARIEPRHHPERHITWGKIRVILDFMERNPDVGIVAFLDSDAFVRDEWGFLSLVEALAARPDKHGVLSRDPLMPKNTYINTGCMILKNDAFTRSFLEAVWEDVHAHPTYRWEWPHEQHASSVFVETQKEAFFVCRTKVLNTPCGDIVRHSWWKDLFAELAMDEMCSTVAGNLERKAGRLPPRSRFRIEDLLDG